MPHLHHRAHHEIHPERARQDRHAARPRRIAGPGRNRDHRLQEGQAVEGNQLCVATSGREGRERSNPPGDCPKREPGSDQMENPWRGAVQGIRLSVQPAPPKGSERTASTGWRPLPSPLHIRGKEEQQRPRPALPGTCPGGCPRGEPQRQKILRGPCHALRFHVTGLRGPSPTSLSAHSYSRYILARLRFMGHARSPHLFSNSNGIVSG